MSDKSPNVSKSSSRVLSTNASKVFPNTPKASEICDSKTSISKKKSGVEQKSSENLKSSESIAENSEISTENSNSEEVLEKEPGSEHENNPELKEIIKNFDEMTQKLQNFKEKLNKIRENTKQLGKDILGTIESSKLKYENIKLEIELMKEKFKDLEKLQAITNPFEKSNK